MAQKVSQKGHTSRLGSSLSAEVSRPYAVAVPPAVGRPQKSADMVQTLRFLGSGSSLPSALLMGTLGPRAMEASLQDAAVSA